jgi:hypothetical protein
MPGAHCTRSLACEDGILECTPDQPGIPARNGFNGLPRALVSAKSARICERVVADQPSVAGSDVRLPSLDAAAQPARGASGHPVYASDDTVGVVLACFRTQPGDVERLLPVGAKGCVSGTAQMFGGTLQIVRSDRIVDEADFVNLSGIDAVRPLIEVLTARPALPGPPTVAANTAILQLKSGEIRRDVYKFKNPTTWPSTQIPRNINYIRSGIFFCSELARPSFIT